MNTLTINFTNEKITVSPSERMSGALFKAFRSEGWLWSRREMAFIFNKNKEGVKRVNRLLQYNFLNNYGIGDAEKEEGNAFIFEFMNAESEKEYKEIFGEYKNEQKAEEERKQSKKEQENKNKVVKLKKVIDQAKELKNGFSVNERDLFNNNLNLLDAGVCKRIFIKDFCEQNGIDSADIKIENKVLFLKIYERDFGNWRTGKQTFLIVDIDEYNEDQRGWRTGGSGCYSCELKICNVERRNIKDYIKLSQALDNELQKMIVKNYINYLRGEKKFSFGITHNHKVADYETEDILRKKYFA